MTRPYQGISLPKSKYPGYEVATNQSLSNTFRFVPVLPIFLHWLTQKRDIVVYHLRKNESQDHDSDDITKG